MLTRKITFLACNLSVKPTSAFSMYRYPVCYDVIGMKRCIVIAQVDCTLVPRTLLYMITI